MPRFQFALSTAETIRESGAVVSPDFAQALSAIGEHASIHTGDRLSIGVPGFPPAQYECVGIQMRGSGRIALWKAQARAA